MNEKTGFKKVIGYSDRFEVKSYSKKKTKKGFQLKFTIIQIRTEYYNNKDDINDRIRELKQRYPAIKEAIKPKCPYCNLKLIPNIDNNNEYYCENCNTSWDVSVFKNNTYYFLMDK